MRTNRRPGPVNANRGDKVGICELRPRTDPVNTNFGVNTRCGPGPVNTNLVPGPVNTRWGQEPGNTKWGPGLVNTNWGAGLVNTNWGPELGTGGRAKLRAEGREIQTPHF